MTIAKGKVSNRIIADEREVLAACLVRLHLGQGQVVRSQTRSGLQVPADERMFSHLREHLEGLGEETLAYFLTKYGPKPEVWETGSRELEAIALSTSPIYNPLYAEQTSSSHHRFGSYLHRRSP